MGFKERLAEMKPELLKTKQQKHDEAFLRGWNSVVPDSEKILAHRHMTTEEIAKKMAEKRLRNEVDTAPYILLEHELNCRVEKVQNFPQYLILAAMFGAAILGWILPQWKPLESKTSLDILADHMKHHNEWYESAECKKEREGLVNPPPVQPRPIVSPIVRQMTEPKGNTKNDDSKTEHTNKQPK